MRRADSNGQVLCPTGIFRSSCFHSAPRTGSVLGAEENPAAVRFVSRSNVRNRRTGAAEPRPRRASARDQRPLVRLLLNADEVTPAHTHPRPYPSRNLSPFQHSECILEYFSRILVCSKSTTGAERLQLLRWRSKMVSKDCLLEQTRKRYLRRFYLDLHVRGFRVNEEERQRHSGAGGAGGGAV
ncbi:hypothetical protein EVAR_25244_1 [Eumeta japonica]|uniref:Uncharacterized protein n=1 Tax=Eumeta variegata TaxID=151549 RepID=A0A4C1WK68_EUMVA|nr:hypothetical protein EVAR_25244_1 [Eumeta japonica]